MQTVTAAELSFDILLADFHRPFINGKANRDKIEDMITIGMLSGELGYLDQATVDLAIEMIDDLVVQYGDVK
jgi:hypothetical protein